MYMYILQVLMTWKLKNLRILYILLYTPNADTKIRSVNLKSVD